MTRHGLSRLLIGAALVLACMAFTTTGRGASAFAPAVPLVSEPPRSFRSSLVCVAPPPSDIRSGRGHVCRRASQSVQARLGDLHRTGGGEAPAPLHRRPPDHRIRRQLPLPRDRLSTRRRGWGRTERAGASFADLDGARVEIAIDAEGMPLEKARRRSDGSVRPLGGEIGHAVSPCERRTDRAQQRGDRRSGLLLSRRRRPRGKAPLRRRLQRRDSDRGLSLRAVVFHATRRNALGRHGRPLLRRRGAHRGCRPRRRPAGLSRPHNHRVGCRWRARTIPPRCGLAPHGHLAGRAPAAHRIGSRNRPAAFPS